MIKSMLLSIIIFISFNSTLQSRNSTFAKEMEIVVRQALWKYNLKIRHNDNIAKCGFLEDEFHELIDLFNKEALSRSLYNQDELNYYFPQTIKVLFYDHDCYDSEVDGGDYYSKVSTDHDLHFKHGQYYVSDQNISSFIDYLIDSFPQKGTEQARQYKLRNRAVRTAIMDKIKAVADNVSISVGYWGYTNSADGTIHGVSEIGHFFQERLLQALLNIEQDNYPENLLIEEYNVHPWNSTSFGATRGWNSWFWDDEGAVENVINDYIQKILIKEKIKASRGHSE